MPAPRPSAPPHHRTRLRSRRSWFALLTATLLTATGLSSAALTPAAASPATSSMCPGASLPQYGPNVCVFTPSMSQSAIQADLDNISTQQVPVGAQFDSDRYAVFFEPGTYGSAANPLVFQVGYYTQVAGLGSLPQDTVVDGAIDVFNNLCTAGTQDCNSDDNFWRSLSNLTLNVDLPSSPPDYAPPVVDAYGPTCTNGEEAWSVSQADPLRRMIINGNVVLQDTCAAEDYASGGFIADSEINGDLDFYGNQQFMVRNSEISGSNGCPQGLWNNVYSGVQGAPSPVFTGQCEQNTVLPSSPVTEEEPFLYLTSGGHFEVFVPHVEHDTDGPSWASGSEAGRSIPLSSFFIAKPGVTVTKINAELAQGKNLILTPGVYDTNQAIKITHPNTIVLGQGFATLVPQQGNAAMDVSPNVGVKLSGLLIDAGPVHSSILLSVGTAGPSTGHPSPAADPDLIQDVFFRIGGAETTTTSAGVSLLDRAGHSIIDDVWAWRADHGSDVGWTDNTAATGAKVTGNNVTAYGLAVEHYQKDEVIWRGQGGTDVFFQNELPYDPPSQTAWMASPTQDGYPAFLVSPGVKTFHGYGMGSYVVFIDTSVTLYDAEAFEAPDTPGVTFSNIFGVWIAGSGGDNSIINGTGGPVTSTSPGTVEPVDLTSYP